MVYQHGYWGEREGLTCIVHGALHTRHSEGLLCHPNYVTAPGTSHLLVPRYII